MRACRKLIDAKLDKEQRISPPQFCYACTGIFPVVSQAPFCSLFLLAPGAIFLETLRRKQNKDSVAGGQSNKLIKETIVKIGE